MRTFFTINGKRTELSVSPEETLLHVLRNNGYTEVKNGCEEGECGACMVLLDGKAVPSCQILALSVTAKSITTIRGLDNTEGGKVLQKNFVDSGAVQCGFCTPGMILSAYSLLKETPRPSEKDIKHALDGNLCRCTGYVKIVEAVKRSAEMLDGKI